MDTNILIREELREEFKDQFPEEEKKDCEADKFNSNVVKDDNKNDNNTVNNYVKTEETILTEEKDILTELSNFCENLFTYTNDITDQYFAYKCSDMEDINTEDDVHQISSIHFSNIIVEINKNKFNFLKVYKHKNFHLENNNYTYTYSAGMYIKSLNVESQRHKNISEALSDLSILLRKYKYCNNCSEGYNSIYGNYCPKCLVTDFFCFSNDKICCPICLEETKTFLTLKCGHRMHKTCIEKLSKKNCPICRHVINI
jgi:hypothetical protein